MHKELKDILQLMRGADRTPVVVRLPRPIYFRLKELLKKQKLTWTDFLTLASVELADRLETKDDSGQS